MDERFLQFLWKKDLFLSHISLYAGGDRIEIMDRGEQNPNSGPDFLNARVRMGEIEWAGNIEIHLKSSNWYRHKHHLDPRYDNVVLHVCLEHDRDVYTISGNKVPDLVVKIADGHLHKYKELMEADRWPWCHKDIHRTDPVKTKLFLGRLAIERLNEKADKFRRSLEETGNNLEESFYRGMASGFGLKINSMQMADLAVSLPFKYLLSNREDLHSIEALLFGQAGFLNEDKEGQDTYRKNLIKQYAFLKRKYSLKPIDSAGWKFLRLRPAGFPTVRIAQFAALIHSAGSLFRSFMEAVSLKEMDSLLEAEASEYWKYHYNFEKSNDLQGRLSKMSVKRLGRQSRQSIIINTVIPFIYLYGKQRGSDELMDRAVKFLEEMPAERNSVIRRWEELGVKADSAFYSQALIQLKDNYCKFKLCLECGIGTQVFPPGSRDDGK